MGFVDSFIAWLVLIFIAAIVLYLVFSYILGWIYPQKEEVELPTSYIEYEVEQEQEQNSEQKKRRRLIAIFIIVIMVILMAGSSISTPIRNMFGVW